AVSDLDALHVCDGVKRAWRSFKRRTQVARPPFAFHVSPLRCDDWRRGESHATSSRDPSQHRSRKAAHRDTHHSVSFSTEIFPAPKTLLRASGRMLEPPTY